MKFVHIVAVPFTGLGLKSGFRGQTWLENRIKIFKQFVLASLVHQSNRDFILLLNWRPEEEGNPAVLELEHTLQSMRDFKFISSYHGILFEDDKYDASLERLAKSLTGTLPEIAPYLGDADTVILTTQPSDDLYLSHAMQAFQDEAQKFKGEPMSIGYREGYMINYLTMELVEYARHDWKQDNESTYTTNTIPPFFSVVFPRSVFLDPVSHMKWAPYRSHEYIAESTDYHELKGPGFIVGTHGENISTTWTHRYKGKMVEGDEKEKVLLQAGLFGVEKVELETDRTRILENKLINMLPQALKRRYVRLRSPGIGSAIDGYKYFRL